MVFSVTPLEAARQADQGEDEAGGTGKPDATELYLAAIDPPALRHLSLGTSALRHFGTLTYESL